MDAADTRLEGLALAWLATRSSRPGTRKELADALHPFVEHRWSRAEWARRYETLVDTMLADALVQPRSRQGLTLTPDGRKRALQFLGVDSPRGLTWKRLKQQHLMARSLELPASKAVLTKLANADGMRAALLKREHAVEGPDAPTLAQVRDRLLWRSLGVETDRPFTLAAVQAHLLSSLLELEVAQPRRALEQLAARAAGAARADAEALRLALLRGWLMADATEAAPRPTAPPPEEARPTAPEPTSARTSFAEHLLAVARALPTGRYGDNKVFISHVWRALQPEWPNREAFDEALLEANRARQLSLSRADLVSAMDPTDVSESEVRALGASFHFVVI
ncbi:hypothetical protein DRW03_12590 [Corallococcus sp. H22C18031201]|nr:hypothetical protein DRW03_12590 [Corallococcus sp. H22C18031201]